VEAASLHRAIRTGDPISGKSRGLVVVEPAPSAPGPSGHKPPRSPLQFLIMIVGAALVLGLGIGFTTGALWMRRRQRKKLTP
jgi:hypothetical protein